MKRRQCYLIWKCLKTTEMQRSRLIEEFSVDRATLVYHLSSPEKLNIPKKNYVFWDIMPCSPVKVNQRFAVSKWQRWSYLIYSRYIPQKQWELTCQYILYLVSVPQLMLCEAWALVPLQYTELALCEVLPLVFFLPHDGSG